MCIIKVLENKKYNITKKYNKLYLKYHVTLIKILI